MAKNSATLSECYGTDRNFTHMVVDGHDVWTDPYGILTVGN